MAIKRFLDKYGLEHFFNLIKTGVIDAKTVNSHTVAKDVPADAEFTDTTYNEATQSAAGLMSAEDKTKLDGMGADSFKITQIDIRDNFVTGNQSVEPNEKKKIVINVSERIPSGGWELAGIVGWFYNSVTSPTPIEVFGAAASRLTPNIAFWAHNTSSSTATPAVVFDVLWKKS